MASELAVGYVSLLPSTRGFGPALNKQIVGPAAAAGSNAGAAAGRSFSSKFAPALSAIKTGLRDVTVGALGIGGVLATLGIKSAASLEQTKVAFTSLLGSTKAATDQIKQLQQFAAKTPFSQSDVLGYAQQYFSLADSVGLAKDQVIPFLTAVGNLGAVTGASTENIHNAVMAIGQIGSAGKVTLENLNQISEAFPGFNGGAAIAAATGQKTAKVLKEISAGAISAQQGIPALLKGMQDFNGAAGAMEKQSKTLNGLFSTFGDTIKIKLTNAFKPLVPVVKRTLGQLTPVIAQTLKNVAPAIASFVKNLAPVLGPLTEGLGKVLGAVFQALGPILKALQPVIVPLANAFVLLVHAFQPFIRFIAQAVRQLLPPLIQLFRIFVHAIEPVAKALFNALRPVLPVIADSLKRLAVALRPVIKAFAGAFADFIREIGPELPGLVKSFADLAVAVVELVKPLTPLIRLLGGLAGALSVGFIKLVEYAIDSIKRWIGWIKDLIGWLEKIPHFGDAMSTSFGNAIDFLNGKSATGVLAVGDLADAFDHTGATAAGAANSLNILNAAAAGIGGIASPLIGAFNGISGAIGAVSGNIKTLLLNSSRALSVLAGLGIPGISAAAAAAAALNAAASGIDTGVQTGGGGGFTVPSGGFGGGGGGGGGKGGGGGSKPPKPGRFDRSTLGQLRQALSGDAAGIKAAVKSIIQSIRQSKQAVPAFVASDAKQLEGLARHRTEIARKLDAANAALQRVQSQYNQVFSSVRSAVAGAFDISTAGTGFDQRQKVTANTILANLRQQANRAVRFGSLLKRLAREGLPKGLLLQLAQAGPAALAQAQALVNATPKQFADIKSEFSRLSGAAQDTGKFLATDLHGAGLKAAQGLVDGLRAKKSALTKAIEDLGEAMIRQLRKTLKMHSPSRRLFDEARLAFDGYEAGVRSKYNDIASATSGIGNASVPKFRAGGGATVHLADDDLYRLAHILATSKPTELVLRQGGRPLAEAVILGHPEYVAKANVAGSRGARGAPR